nr:histidine phosphatase family protein [Psychrobacter sp. PraFG1]UNK06141.1 histidine phosphatase family protein [Psychrobacter sp. PraFG1]
MGESLTALKQVGEYLAAQGFECHVDAQLLETHFGAWEGRLWSDISKDEIDQWCEHFADFAPQAVRAYASYLSEWRLGLSSKSRPKLS